MRYIGYQDIEYKAIMPSCLLLSGVGLALIATGNLMSDIQGSSP